MFRKVEFRPIRIPAVIRTPGRALSNSRTQAAEMRLNHPAIGMNWAVTGAAQVEKPESGLASTHETLLTHEFCHGGQECVQRH